MAKKKDDGSAVILLFIVAFFVFLPFLIFGMFFYRKLKRKYSAIPNIQRVYDIGVIFKTLSASIAVIVVSAVLVLQLSALPVKFVSPEISHYIARVMFVLYPLVMIWPMKKMAERIAIEYFGIIFNDNDRTIILPADLGNMGLGDWLRLKFLSRWVSKTALRFEKYRISHARKVSTSISMVISDPDASTFRTSKSAMSVFQHFRPEPG
ncbi:hypothetical protein K2669_004634 [Salmonella enterica subsp. enterica serovar Virchow]|nr:hypothetical protein [Salmonella enterica subsp. enterica serovar Virchow]EBV3200642.1 hypothetical protein [Salmonella enterica subsp. enterica serovar Virchow]ECD2879264.1 hypothetical protein [Salmonella enterica subsp. enterica serovar Virchow]EDH4107239.1 hypothetical protein [Salmonella enterica subsp. enterica serovar Virchow]EHG4430346.1 hypothetical protein [Salmonella enterica subsp. enterica serovar Virchow]